jgi:hypothetical protein
VDSVEKADKGFKDVITSSIPFKRFLREQNVYLRNLHDEEITGKSHSYLAGEGGLCEQNVVSVF